VRVLIRDAVLLAAGEGSRLRAAAPFKPLCPVAGVPLIDRALAGLAAAGIGRAIVVTGYGADVVEAHLRGSDWPLAVEWVRTPDHRLPNGVSALAAAAMLGSGGAVLAMCDHAVEPALYRRLAEAGAGNGAALGVDRRLGHPWVDPADVTCVGTDGPGGARITAIGKGLAPHDAYDTGVFAAGPALFGALARLPSPSLTEGMRALAARGLARAVDCSDLAWIDVDDAAALAKAEAWLGAPERDRRRAAG